MLALPRSDVRAKLGSMVGAIIYIRVSTKEQTENLSLPTQLRACEEYCRREGFEVLARFKEEGESAKTADRTRAAADARVLPHEQRQGPLPGRLQPDALRAGQVRPLRAALAPEVAWHLAAVGDRADRRHLHRQTDGRRACRIRAVRQRRALGPNARRHAGRARARTLGVPGAARLPQCAARVGQEPDARPRTRADRRRVVRGVRDRPVQRSSRSCSRRRRGDCGIAAAQPLSSQAIGMLLRNQLYAGIVDVPEFGVRDKRGDFEPLVSEDDLLTALRPCCRAARRRRRRSSAAIRTSRCATSCAAPPVAAASRGAGRRDGASYYAYYHCRPGCRGVNVTKAKLEGAVHRRTRPAAADAGIHAAAEGVGPAGLEGAPGGGPAPTSRSAERKATAIQKKLDRLDEAFLFERSIDIDDLRPARREAARGAHAAARIAKHSTELDELDVEGILAFAERVLPRAADLWVQASARPAPAVPTAVLPGGNRVRRPRFCWNRRNRAGFQLLARNPGGPNQLTSGSEEIGGPTRIRTWDWPVMSRRL